jgi:hypothetical protein
MPSALAISQRGGFQITVVTAIVIVGFYLCFREIRRLGSELAAVSAKLDDEAFNIEGADVAVGAGSDVPPGQDKLEKSSGGGASPLQNLLVKIVTPRSAAPGESGAGNEPATAAASGRITEITEP